MVKYTHASRIFRRKKNVMEDTEKRNKQTAALAENGNLEQGGEGGELKKKKKDIHFHIKI